MGCSSDFMQSARVECHSMDLVSLYGNSFARQRLGKGLSVDAVSTLQYFILYMQKRANLTDSPFSKWESGGVLLSHGGESGALRNAVPAA